jgi:hypothetical protein
MIAVLQVANGSPRCRGARRKEEKARLECGAPPAGWRTGRRIQLNWQEPQVLTQKHPNEANAYCAPGT